MLFLRVENNEARPPEPCGNIQINSPTYSLSFFPQDLYFVFLAHMLEREKSRGLHGSYFTQFFVFYFVVRYVPGVLFCRPRTYGRICIPGLTFLLTQFFYLNT